jgi:hypothetical protein
MRIIIISKIEGEKNKIDDFVMSLKNQYYTNFLVYMVYSGNNIKIKGHLRESINGDNRFSIVETDNTTPKTKYFNEIIRDNRKIRWNDVIIDLNMNSEITDNLVMGLVNKTFMDRNILCSNIVFNNDLTNPDNINYEQSNMKMFRKFLFEYISEDGLMYGDEYINDESNLAIYKPIVEMCGSKRHVIINNIVTNDSNIRHNYKNDKIVKFLTSKTKYVEIEMNYLNNKINQVDFIKVKNDTPKEIKDVTISKTTEVKDKKINYEKINNIFMKNNIRLNKKEYKSENIYIKQKTNTLTLNKITKLKGKK